jgi:hypothetical protein
VEGAEVAEEIFRLAVSKGWVLRELSRQAVSLEDVFVRLTHHEEIEPAPAAEEPLPSEIPAEAEAAGQSSETSQGPDA